MTTTHPQPQHEIHLRAGDKHTRTFETGLGDCTTIDDGGCFVRNERDGTNPLTNPDRLPVSNGTANGNLDITFDNLLALGQTREERYTIEVKVERSGDVDTSPNRERLGTLVIVTPSRGTL